MGISPDCPIQGKSINCRGRIIQKVTSATSNGPAPDSYPPPARKPNPAATAAQLTCNRSLNRNTSAFRACQVVRRPISPNIARPSRFMTVIYQGKASHSWARRAVRSA